MPGLVFGADLSYVEEDAPLFAMPDGQTAPREMPSAAAGRSVNFHPEFRPESQHVLGLTRAIQCRVVEQGNLSIRVPEPAQIFRHSPPGLAKLIARRRIFHEKS